jgi:hypothetical protein
VTHSSCRARFPPLLAPSAGSGCGCWRCGTTGRQDQSGRKKRLNRKGHEGSQRIKRKGRQRREVDSGEDEAMLPYKEKYPVGTSIRIASMERLLEFKRTWKYHHPISDEQIKAAGKVDKVKGVSFYHGGDALYRLEGAGGTWHEQVLDPANSSA